MKNKIIHVVIMCFVASACMAEKEKPQTIGQLVAKITAAVKSNDWEKVKLLAINPESSAAIHQLVVMMPRNGKLDKWDSLDAKDAKEKWGADVDFLEDDSVDIILRMKWEIPINEGLGEVIQYYPIVLTNGHYYIRFYEVKNEVEVSGGGK